MFLKAPWNTIHVIENRDLYSEGSERSKLELLLGEQGWRSGKKLASH